jgi:hypothetical protein
VNGTFGDDRGPRRRRPVTMALNRPWFVGQGIDGNRAAATPLGSALPQSEPIVSRSAVTVPRSVCPRASAMIRFGPAGSKPGVWHVSSMNCRRPAVSQPQSSTSRGGGGLLSRREASGSGTL